MGGDDLNAPIRMLYSKYEMVVKLSRWVVACAPELGFYGLIETPAPARRETHSGDDTARSVLALSAEPAAPASREAKVRSTIPTTSRS